MTEKTRMAMLNEELENAGVPVNALPRHFVRRLLEAGLSEEEVLKQVKPLDPIDSFVSGGVSAKPYIDIILKHANEMDLYGKSWIARVVTEKGFKEAVPFLLSIFHEWNGEQGDLWAVGNALYVINDKASYPAVLEICKNKKYGGARKMLMGTLARMKTPEAFQTLVGCLDDSDVRGHAIEALGRFGDVKAIPILEATEVEKGLYEFKAKNTALRRLRRKLDKQNK